jgi:hypothetical protein
VADLRVDAEQVRPLQRVNERDGVAEGGQEDVAARLVRLGLEREPDAVALAGDVVG